MSYQVISLQYAEKLQLTEPQKNAIDNELRAMARRDNRAVLLGSKFSSENINFLLRTTERINDNHIGHVSRKLTKYHSELFPKKELFHVKELLWINSPFTH